jgi:hypothetical protein
MNVRVRDAFEFEKKFTGDVEDVKEYARNVSMLFERLSELGTKCVGLRVKINDALFVVIKEGDSLVLETIDVSGRDSVSGEFFFPHLADAY